MKHISLQPQTRKFLLFTGQMYFQGQPSYFPCTVKIQQDMTSPMIKISHLHMKLLSASFKKMLKDEKLFLILKLKHFILKLSK